MTSKYDEGDEQHSFDDPSCNGDDNDNNDEYDDHGEEYYNEHDDGDKLGYDDNDESSSSAHSQQQSSMAPTMTASRSSRSRSSSRYRDEYLRRTLAGTNTTDDDDEAVLRRERTVNALRQLNHMVLGSSFGNSNSSSRSSRSRMRGSDDDTSSRAPQLRVSPSSGRWRVVTPTTSKEYEEDNNEEEYEEDNNEEEYEEHDYVQSYYHDEKEDDEDKEEDYDEDDDGTYVDNSNNRYIEAEEGVQDYNNSHYQEDQQWSEQQRRSNNSYHDAGRNQQLQPAPPTTHSRFVSGTVVREDSGGTGSSCAFYPQPFKSQKQRTYHRTSSNNIINNNNKGRGTKSLPSSRPGFTPPMQQQPRSPESDHPPPLTMEEDVISTMSASAITIGSRKPKLTHQQQQLQLLARADSNSRAVIPTKVVFPIKTSRNEGGTRCLSQQQHQQYYSRRTTNELEMSDAIIVRPSYNKPLSSIDSRPRPNKMVGRGKSFSSATTTTTTRRSSIDRSTTNNVVQSRRSSLMRMISDGDNSSRRRTRSSSRGGSIDRSTRSSSQGGGSSRRRTRYSSRSSGRKDSQQRSIVSTRIRSQSLERRDGNGRRPSSNDYRRPSSSTVRSMSKGRRTTPTSYINNDMIISRPKKMQEEYNNDWRITTSKSLMMQQHHNIDDEGYCQYHPDIRLMKLRQDGRWRVLRKKCQKCSSASSRCISNSRGGNLARSSSRSSHHRSRRIAYDHYDNDYDDDDSRSYTDSTTMEVESAATSSSPTESMSFLDLGMSLQTPEEMEAEEATNRLKRRLAARAYHFPGNTWWQDWLQYLSNTHTVLGLFFHHPLHPMRFKERVVMLLGSIAIGLTISNFTYMYYIKNGYSMDEVVVDLGFVVVTRLMITLWTLGSFIHTIFDLLLWHTKACTICRYKGQFDESLSRWGRVFGLFVVGCAMFAGAYAVLIRATIDYKDEGSISEEVMESIKSNEIYRIEFEDKRSFKFLMGYLIEFVLAMFVYYPIAVTILFSGVLGCGGRIPILGGRPREMKKETRYEMNKRQPKILKALNIEGDWSDLSGSRTYSRSDIV